jgi:hypothetical protein
MVRSTQHSHTLPKVLKFQWKHGINHPQNVKILNSSYISSGHMQYLKINGISRFPICHLVTGNGKIKTDRVTGCCPSLTTTGIRKDK